MKASVITLHTVDNYGSAMQTYATQQVLKKCGCEVEFVDYWRKDNLPRSKAEKLLEGNTLKKLKPIWGLNNFTRSAAVSVLEKMLKSKKSPMWQFLEKNVSMTQKQYCSFEELLADTPAADAYVTGSDQVWNSIWNNGIDKAYFLDYAPEGKPRIAFSANIGRESLDADEIAPTKALLDKYKAISVREKSAVELLASMGIKSTLILDPTLMLEPAEWRALAAPVNVDKPYVLVYQLNPNPEMDDYSIKLAKKKGWEVVRIGFGNSDKGKADKCIMLPSVEEFLGLFCHASCVLTDSFHATAFSLNLGTDFISILPGRFGTRIESILKLTGTENRLLKSYDDFDVADAQINKTHVQEIFANERIKGYSFLKEALD